MSPAMDIDYDTTPKMQRTMPIRIASAGRISTLASQADDLPIPKLDHEAIKEKAKRRKKNKKKPMAAGAPAANVIKGFHTPVTSGGEESDISAAATPLLGAVRNLEGMSITSSPSMKPLTPGGISTLKARLDALDLDGNDRRGQLARIKSNTSIPTESSMTSSHGSDGDRNELDTYEVELGREFVSSDVGSTTPLQTAVLKETRSIHRKMYAEDFEPLRCLGKGAFGTVHLVRQRETGRLYAQKQFRKASLTVHKRLVEQTRAERSILESVNRHPFVVKLYYAFQDHEKLYLILEYGSGGELFHHLSMERMFSESVAAFYMAEMVLALEHLHTNVRVIYRDLKPENCLLDAEGHLLLTDFGLSKVALEDERTSSVLGTIEYMAPEVIEGRPYDFAVDWWSFGAIGFDMMTGAPPFGGKDHARIEQNILKQPVRLPYYLSSFAKDFLTRLLHKNPSKRLGSAHNKGIKALKAHSFFRKIDWHKLERRELEPPIQPVITDPELAENFSAEFTSMALSRDSLLEQPDETTMEDAYHKFETDPFGGFSFVASKSLLDNDDFMLGA